MLIHIPKVISATQLIELRTLLNSNEQLWVDGRVTAGYQGASVKNNQQCDEQAELTRRCQQIIVAALETNPLFISAALPNIIYPPMFNRYSQGMQFGAHVDGSVRIHPITGQKLRTDLSATLFLAEPDEYDGGELQINDNYGAHSVKLAAGDLVLYPASSLHLVTPITRGMRLACFFWVQSLVREDAQRTILFDLDTAIQALHHEVGDAQNPALKTLVACYHNLMRLWCVT